MTQWANRIISDKWVSWIILLNATVLLLDEFPSIHEKTNGELHWVDFGCILYFLLEASLKIKSLGIKGYFTKGWNQFDFAVTVLSLPVLITPFIDQEAGGMFVAVSLLRTSRIFRFFRLLKFIPNIDHLVKGVGRALRASIGIFIALIIINIVLSLVATITFGHLSEKHFGNPIKSSYSLLKIFTVEGWYEIPEDVEAQGGNEMANHFLHAYVIFAVVTGGILGMGLANAIFVDEMTADNTQKVERMVKELHQEIISLRKDLAKETPKSLPPT